MNVSTNFSANNDSYFTNTSTYDNDTVSNSRDLSVLYQPPPLSSLIPILIVLVVAIFLAAAGNGFTIYAFIRHESLRTPFNAYIFNLAISDFFVGAIVMPCFTIYSYHGYWPLGEPLCSIWVFTDWFMTFESVLTLAVISLERFWSVTWPVSYRQKNTLKNVLIIIIVTWLVVCCIWMPGFFYDRLNHNNVVEDCAWDPSTNYSAGVVIGILGYLIPYVFMVVCYTYVGWKMRKRLKRVAPKVRYNGQTTSIGYMTQVSTVGPSNGEEKKVAEDNDSGIVNEPQQAAMKEQNKKAKAAANRERSALITLGAIVIAFSVCWLPFYAFFFVTLFNWTTLPGWFLTLTYWMAYLNSAANPVLYTVLHRDFRRIFLALFKFGKK